MTSIDLIREQLKKFEENIKTEEGIEYLRSALEEIAMILEDSSSGEQDVRFAQNILRKYCHIVLEMAKAVWSAHGTPSSDELWLIVKLMGIFKENGLVEDPDFKDAYGKTVMLWLEIGRMEGSGDKLDDSLKNEIYDTVIKNFDSANRDRNKLKIGLFDKRFPIFENVKKFIASILMSGRVNEGAEIQFLRDTKSVRFLFEEDAMILKLTDEIYKKATKLTALQQMEGRCIAEDLAANLEKQDEIKEWYRNQLNKIDEAFKRYLILKH